MLLTPGKPQRESGSLKRRVSAIDIEQGDLRFLPDLVPGKQPRNFSDAEKTKMQRYESVNTYEPQTTIYKDHLEYRSREPRWFIWVFVFVVGCLTALTAVVMVSSLHTLFAIRMRLLQFGLMGFSFNPVPAMYDNDEHVSTESSVFSGQDAHLFGLPNRDLGGGFLMWALFSFVMATGAAIVSALVPDSVGPGSPEVLAYLNGVENPSFDDFRVFFAKMISTMFTVASGVPLGFYGTLAQAGTMVATFLLGRTKLFRLDSIRVVCCFRNPRDKRIVTVVGAAAGFASAFSVSIGGLMLVMEQLSTVLPVRFALYVFVACLVSSVFIETYFSHLSYFGFRDRSQYSTGQLISEVLIQFDTKVSAISPVPMNIFDFLPAVLIGVCCGYLAIAYIRIHGFALNLRRRLEVRYRTKFFRYLMPIMVAVLYTSSVFWISAALGGSMDNPSSCQLVPVTISATRNVSVISFYGLSGSLCEPHLITSNTSNASLVVNHTDNVSYYAPPIMHTFSSLSFGFADSTLQLLLSWRTEGAIPASLLVLFGTMYFFFSAFASGISLTGDVMLPVMVIGACFGRLIGLAVFEIGKSINFHSETWTDPGVFALIGAGCFFGGATGMTFSICVILIEVTDDFRHLLPLMLGISIAKRITERYSHNVNTTYLETRCVPLLDFDARIHKYDMFCAKHVMTTNVVTLNTVSSIEEVMQTLRSCSHNAFPTASVRDGTFKGIILRQQLVLYLWHIYVTNNHAGCSYEQLQRVEDRLFYEGDQSDELNLPPFDDYWLADRVDLSAHIDQSGFCTLDTTSISRTYHMFRTLGLRHLVIVNKENNIVGIITRKDLVTDNIIKMITEENNRRKRQLAMQRRDMGLDDGDELGMQSGLGYADEWIVADEVDDDDCYFVEPPISDGLPPSSRSVTSFDTNRKGGQQIPPRLQKILHQVPSVDDATSSVTSQSAVDDVRETVATEQEVKPRETEALSQKEGSLGSSFAQPPSQRFGADHILHRRTVSVGRGAGFPKSASRASVDSYDKPHGSVQSRTPPPPRRPQHQRSMSSELPVAANSFSSAPPYRPRAQTNELQPSSEGSDDSDASFRAVKECLSAGHDREVSSSSEDSVEILRRQNLGPTAAKKRVGRKVLVLSPIARRREDGEDVVPPPKLAGTSSDVSMEALSEQRLRELQTEGCEGVRK